MLPIIWMSVTAAIDFSMPHGEDVDGAKGVIEEILMEDEILTGLWINGLTQSGQWVIRQ